MRTIRCAVVLGAAGLALAGCGTTQCDKPAPFESARQGEPLAVPGDLAKPESSGKFEIPEAGRDGTVRGPCGDLPPMAPRSVAADPAEDEAATDAEAPIDDGPLPTLDTTMTAAAPETAAAPAVSTGLGPIAVTGGIERDIRESVISWVKAWRAADGPALVSFYSSNFEPPLGDETRDEWAARRATLLSQTGPSDVRYDVLTVTETFAGVNARFIQEFHDRGRIDAVIKSLEFQVEDGRWLIVRERVLEVL